MWAIWHAHRPLRTSLTTPDSDLQLRKAKAHTATRVSSPHHTKIPSSLYCIDDDSGTTIVHNTSESDLSPSSDLCLCLILSYLIELQLATHTRPLLDSLGDRDCELRLRDSSILQGSSHHTPQVTSLIPSIALYCPNPESILSQPQQAVIFISVDSCRQLAQNHPSPLTWSPALFQSPSRTSTPASTNSTQPGLQATAPAPI